MSAELEEERLPSHLVELINRGRQAKLVDDIRAVVSAELRHGLPEAMRDVVRDEVGEALKGYFGDREPSHVQDVIRSAENWHRRIHTFTESFWTTVASKLFGWILWIFLIVHFLAANKVVNIPIGNPAP